MAKHKRVLSTTAEAKRRALAVADAAWEHEKERAAAAKSVGRDTYYDWHPQKGSPTGRRGGWEYCPHESYGVAPEATREFRQRVESCDACRAWRFARTPTPKAPLVSFAYDGLFCLLPAWAIGMRAKPEKREDESEEAAA